MLVSIEFIGRLTNKISSGYRVNVRKEITKTTWKLPNLPKLWRVRFTHYKSASLDEHESFTSGASIINNNDKDITECM